MKKLAFVLVVVLVASLFAVAQEEKGSVFGGYQFLSLGGNGARESVPKGWDADVAFKATKSIGIVGDIAGNYKDGGSFYTFQFGPRFSFPSGKVTPFAEVLAGGAHLGGGDVGVTKFSMAFGGGLDYSVNKSVGVRLAKFDYNYVQGDGGHLNNFRVATGIVFKF